MTSRQTTTPAPAAALGSIVLLVAVLLVQAPRADAFCASDCGPTAHGWLAFVLLAVVLAVAGAIIFVASGPQRALRARRKTVELAAQRVAEADPAFGPVQVRAAAAQLFRDVYAAWNSGDRNRLGELLGTAQLHEWIGELDQLTRQGRTKRVTVRAKLTIDYIALDRPGGNRDGSVVVHIVTLLGTSFGSPMEAEQPKPKSRGIEEYWTLARREQGWVVSAIEQRKEGRRHLDEPIVTGLSAVEGDR